MVFSADGSRMNQIPLVHNLAISLFLWEITSASNESSALIIF